jgi:phosphoglycolate phosphatase
VSDFSLFVFDLDGTLIDSRQDIADAANRLIESCGFERLPAEQIGRMIGEGAATLVARVFATVGAAAPPDALDRFLALYEDGLLRHTRAYGGIPEVLAAVAERASMAVLTNKPLVPTLEILEGLDLARHFRREAIIGGDGSFPRKPDPDGLLHLADRFGVTREATLLVGDSLIDWRTSRNASIPICLARYGFGFEQFPVERLSGDERLIDRPIDLLAL